MKRPIDVRIANFLKKKAENYIRFRMKPIDIEEENNKRWLSNFVKGNESFVHQLNDEIKINLYKDSILCKYIFISFEEAEIIFLNKFLKPGNVFFDVGANIGLFSLHASKRIGTEGRVCSFEPSPETYKRLKKNFEVNDINNAVAENVGLSEKKDILKFNVSNSGYDAWNSFANLSDVGEFNCIDVPVISLDEYIIREKISKINLIKIDVEGWELFVLKGATNLLSSDDAPVLMIEFTETNTFSAGYYCGELFDYMKSFGYEWYSYNAQDNELDPQIKKLHYPYENLIAIKDIEKVKLILNS